MIRRDVTDSNGQPAWVLISQVDHARLAARVAEVWGKAPFTAIAPRDEVLAGIEHHDDGWANWDRSPKVDIKSGRPLDFTEVSIDDSLPIWQLSIEAAAQCGPLSGCLVAGHFTALLRRFSSRWNQVPADYQRVMSFLARQESATATWLSQWSVLHGATSTHAQATAARGLAELQWFDLLSLWLCCGERNETVTFETPSGRLTITPQSERRMHLAPWPLTVPQLEMDVPGRQVEARRYRSMDDLAQAVSSDVILRWTLLP